MVKQVLVTVGSQSWWGAQAVAASLAENHFEKRKDSRVGKSKALFR